MSGTAREWSKRYLKPTLDSFGLNWEEIEDRGWFNNPKAPDVPFQERRFDTEDGKFHFLREFDDSRLVKPDSEFPYNLVTPKAQSSHLSQVPPDPSERFVLHISSDTAKAENLENGQMIEIESRFGELEAEVLVSSRVKGQCCIIFFTTTQKPERRLNNLLGHTRSLDGAMPGFYDCKVRLNPISEKLL